MTATWLMLMALFIIEMFAYAWCRVQCVNIGYAIGRANDRSRELLSLQNNLTIELEHLKSPERIAKIAREHIGLVKPSQEQMVIIQ